MMGEPKAQIRLIDKPVGFSSFQIVNIFKKKYKKVGHAGTLDPFASGLLIILINSATKSFVSYQRCEKEYVGEILLGMTTDTYDITGKISDRHDAGNSCDFTLEQLNDTAGGFIGTIEQIPPKFSALKQRGAKLYQLSRKGIAVQPKKRRVMVHDFSITGLDFPVICFHSLVGRGVYIRSLAHSLGQELGCGATMLSLKRIRIGEHRLQDAEKMGQVLV
jgi:tRNA pseudouridine55 synthase